MARPAIIVHGGAGRIRPGREEAALAGVRAAAEAGWAVLERGGHALEAVVAAIRAMEADPTFNAGVGAVLNADGHVELDAGLMRGSDLAAGGVGALREVAHPIEVARRVLEDGRTVLLVGEGARRFALERGIPPCPELDLITPDRLRQWETWRQRDGTLPGGGDTVGAVALDREGRIAAGTSTGGLLGKLPGRVGDSPLPGAGFYADDRAGGAAATGIGETIMRILMSHEAVRLLEAGVEPMEAARRAVGLLERVRGQGGLVLLDREGRVGWARNTPQMSYAYRTGSMAATEAGL